MAGAECCPTPPSTSASPPFPGVEPGPTRNLAWVAVGVLTLLSAFLRFAVLHDPVVWGDEAAVAWRTCGSFADLTEILQNDGFVPLHYEFYWVVGRFTPLTPLVLRLLPTLAAIAMVPAMYVLANQLVNRQTALVVAAFTAVSSHLGWHAQDAKMYAHFWLMCVLSTTCLLYWMRNGSRPAFLGWVLTGVAMVGLHSLGWGMVGVQAALAVVPDRHDGRPMRRLVARFAAFGLGLMVIAVGPLVYYLSFNRWGQNIEAQGWDASGIAWINQWFSPDPYLLVRDTMNHFLFGYDYPPPNWRGVTPVGVWVAAVSGPFVLMLLMAACLFPFPRRRRWGAAAGEPTDWPATAFRLAVWVLLPPYAFYSASVADFTWPHQAVGRLIFPDGFSWVTFVLGVLVVGLGVHCCGTDAAARWRKVRQLLAVVGGLAGLAYLLAAMVGGRAPGPVWVSRYLGFVWPGFVIAFFALLGRLPVATLRWTLTAVLLATNLYMIGMRHRLRQDPPLDRLATDFVAAAGDSGTIAEAIALSPRERLSDIAGRYYLFLYSGRPTYPKEFVGGSVADLFGLPEAGDPASIAERLRQRPQTRRIVVWKDLPMANVWTTPSIPGDEILSRLPDGWRCASEELYPFRSRWGLGVMKGAWLRREFVSP